MDLQGKCRGACSIAVLEAWPRGAILAEELWKMDPAEDRCIMGRTVCYPGFSTMHTVPVGGQDTAAEQHWPSLEGTDRFMGLNY